MFHGKNVSVNRTALAGAYTAELCTTIARLVARSGAARGLPPCHETVAEQERSLRLALDAAEVEVGRDSIEIPREFLDFVSGPWRSRLVELGLLQADAVVHGNPA